MFKINWCKIFGHKTYTTISIIVGDSMSYDTYIDILKVNGREKEIEIIIAETPKIEETFNKLYQIVINGNYKFD